MLFRITVLLCCAFLVTPLSVATADPGGGGDAGDGVGFVDGAEVPLSSEPTPEPEGVESVDLPDGGYSSVSQEAEANYEYDELPDGGSSKPSVMTDEPELKLGGSSEESERDYMAELKSFLFDPAPGYEGPSPGYLYKGEGATGMIVPPVSLVGGGVAIAEDLLAGRITLYATAEGVSASAGTVATVVETLGAAEPVATTVAAPLLDTYAFPLAVGATGAALGSSGYLARSYWGAPSDPNWNPIIPREYRLPGGMYGMGGDVVGMPPLNLSGTTDLTPLTSMTPEQLSVYRDGLAYQVSTLDAAAKNAAYGGNVRTERNLLVTRLNTVRATRGDVEANPSGFSNPDLLKAQLDEEIAKIKATLDQIAPKQAAITTLWSQWWATAPVVPDSQMPASGWLNSYKYGILPPITAETTSYPASIPTYMSAAPTAPAE